MAGARHRPLYLGIDFGTTVTVAAGLRPGGEPELVRFGDDRWMPSAVHFTPAGEVLVGSAAVAATAADPAGGQLTPKAMMGSGLEVETLRGRPLPLIALVAHVIAAAHRAAVEQLGAPTQVALTCPVAWAPAGPAAVKRPVLRAAAQLAGVGAGAMVLDEAEAAAHHVGDGALPVEEDELFALYDLGGGTCDIAVLRREVGRLNPVALAEAEVGGEHFDWLLYEHVLGRLDPDAAGGLRDAADAGWRRCHAELAAEVRRAKEALGAADAVTIHVPAPVEEDVTVTAEQLDALIEPDVRATAEELRSAIARATEAHGGDVSTVHLVGGSSLLPLVPRVVEAVTGRPVRRAGRPRAAVALGAVQALEAWSGPGRPTRRGARGEELHARRVLTSGAMGGTPVLVRTDTAGCCVISRLDPARGAADRTVTVTGPPPDALVAGDEVVAATSSATVRVWDAELRVVDLTDHGALPGPLRALHASHHGVWIVYEGDDGALWLRTIVVPDAAADEPPLIRDVAIVAAPAGDSTHDGGGPGLVTAAYGRRLLVAVRVRGAGGSEQHVFAAAADGRLRKVTTREAGPWLLDWVPTALGAVELEGALDGDGVHAPRVARLGDAARLELDPAAHATAMLIPSAGTAAVVIGTDDGWEAHRIDPSARGGDGTHLLCRESGASLVAGRRPVPTRDGGWLLVRSASGGTAAVLVGADGVAARASVPDGARILCGAGGRLYVVAGDELRSVAVTTPGPGGR
jgi:actin-like ATPase involved in cell morphogenesis